MTAVLVIAVWSILAGGLCAAIAAVADTGPIEPSTREVRARVWGAFCGATLITSVVLSAVWYGGHALVAWIW